MWHINRNAAWKTVLGMFLMTVFCASIYSCKNDDNDDSPSKKTPETVKMTFHTADGSGRGGYWKEDEKKIYDKVITIPYGSTGFEQKPADPVSDEAGFTGWYEPIGSALSTKEYSFGKEITDDIVLYAGWDFKAKIKITFDTTHDSLKTDPVYIFPGELVPNPGAPKGMSEQKKFAGWFTSTKFNQIFDFATTRVSEPITLYAYIVDWRGKIEELFKQKFDQYDDIYIYGGDETYLSKNKDSVCTWFREKGGARFSNHDPEFKLNISGLSTLTKIDEGLFEGSRSLEQIILPYNVKEIGNKAFNDADIRSVTLPEKLEIIGDEAFRDCKLKELALPDTLKKIGVSSFQDNDDLTNVVIPEGVEEIGENAFAGIKNLVPVLPASLKTLHPFAFWESVFGDRKIKYNGTKEQFKKISIPSVSNGKDPFTIVCSDGEINDSKVYLRTK